MTTPDFKAEQRANVYLVRVDGAWEIDPVTLDGYPLDGLDAADTDKDRDALTDEERTLLAEADAASLPTAEELFQLLAAKLELFTVLTGNPADGFTHYGPFTNAEDAEYFTETTLRGKESWTVHLQHP